MSITQVQDALNQILADEHILLMRTRNYHWNISGINFKPLHELFEEQYNELFVSIDSLAERIKTIGGTPLSTLSLIKSKGKLVEELSGVETGQDMLNQLQKDHEHIIEHIKQLMESQNTDLGTESFLGGLLEQHEKMAWMLKESSKG